MSRITYSPGNKAFITKLFTAFKAQDYAAFAVTFAQHGNAAKYRYDNNQFCSSDYNLLRELCENHPGGVYSLEEQNVRTLLLSLSSIGTLSTETKVALYFLSYTGMDDLERDSFFGEGGALSFSASDLSTFKERLLALEYQEAGEMMIRFREFYRPSVHELHSPEVYSKNFSITYAMGALFPEEINRLKYQDTPGGQSKFEMYSKILDSVDNEAIPHLIYAGRSALLSYEMVKQRGAEWFSLSSKSYTPLFQKAFQNADVQFFTQLSGETLKGAGIDAVDRLRVELESIIGDDSPSEIQQSMLNEIGFVRERAIAQREKYIDEQKQGRRRLEPDDRNYCEPSL